MGMKKKKGQVLVLVLLVVVVALAVGLSVASRNLTNLRITTQSEQSQRAFNAAEGGIEHALSVLKTGAWTGVVPPVGDITPNVTVDERHQYNSVILEGDVGQIELTNASNFPVRIEWAKSSDSLEQTSPASIEITVIRGLPGNYTQQRFAWEGTSLHGASEAGFKNPGDDPGSSSCLPTGFEKCGRIDPLGTNPVLLRIRPFWNQATVKVVSDGGTLPLQQYDITSSATTELGLTRKVQVTKTVLPQLPAVFDYVLYSEGDITK